MSVLHTQQSKKILVRAEVNIQQHLHQLIAGPDGLEAARIEANIFRVTGIDVLMTVVTVLRAAFRFPARMRMSFLVKITLALLKMPLLSLMVAICQPRSIH